MHVYKKKEGMFLKYKTMKLLKIKNSHKEIVTKNPSATYLIIEHLLSPMMLFLFIIALAVVKSYYSIDILDYIVLYMFFNSGLGKENNLDAFLRFFTSLKK